MRAGNELIDKIRADRPIHSLLKFEWISDDKKFPLFVG